MKFISYYFVSVKKKGISFKKCLFSLVFGNIMKTYKINEE